MSFNKDQSSYRALRDIVAERTSRLVAWVGAGLSAPANIPTWIGLRDCLVREGRSIAPTLEASARADLLKKCDAALNTPTLWTAFKILQRALGKTTYKETIRNALAPAATAAVPPVYRQLWSLRLGGILNLNLDRLATRAYSAVHSEGALGEFSGREAGAYAHLLKSTNPFVANLHGIADAASSWVFTATELHWLLNTPGYQNFITACLTTRTIVFVGISADDPAAGEHLARLTSLGIDFGSHFWITPRNDAQTDRWAEQSGIRVIRYTAIGDDHSELSELMQDLLSYVPVEITAPPVKPPDSASAISGPLPPPDELERLSAEDIRKILNAHAARMLAVPDEAAYHSYSEFLKQYESPIYRAWFVTPRGPNNSLFGNTILDQGPKGAFGRVYRAQSPDGAQLAVKVMHSEILHNEEMLQCFRRGVRSMQILTKYNIKGMVPCRWASEIPACATMEFIEGPNLAEYVRSHPALDWHTVLRIALDLATIIRAGHMLPERVLHRDIRPSNIMLKGYYADRDEWEVVVLDFDLSWHRDAMGLSLDNSSSVNGYLAPEQVDPSSKDSTRNALVDSFGLGMTLFFLRSGRDPVFSQQKHADWREQLTNRIASHKASSWVSLPRRFARLIEWSTRHRQAERWDMSQIAGELQRLKEAHDSPSCVQSAELFAEELAARSHLGGRYDWSRDLNEASLALPNGVIIKVAGDETNRTVWSRLSWVDKGFGTRRKVGKWLYNAFGKADGLLRKAAWNSTITAASKDDNAITARIDVSSVWKHMESLTEGLTEAVECLNMQ